MQQIRGKIIIFLSVLALAQTQSDQKKLKVTVLYESLCPDSIRFMQRQLGVYYDSLKDYIDIELVPFGKSHSEDDGAKFYCQHGPAECDGNRKQSCVLAQTQDQAAQVEFAVCQMTVPDKNSVDYCAQSAGLRSDIEQCLQTDLGTRLQLHAEKITQQFSPSFVPTIVYDNQFDQDLQDRSIRNFMGTVCGILKKRGYITEYTAESPC